MFINYGPQWVEETQNNPDEMQKTVNKLVKDNPDATLQDYFDLTELDYDEEACEYVITYECDYVFSDKFYDRVRGSFLAMLAYAGVQEAIDEWQDSKQKDDEYRQFLAIAVANTEAEVTHNDDGTAVVTMKPFGVDGLH